MGGVTWFLARPERAPAALVGPGPRAAGRAHRGRGPRRVGRCPTHGHRLRAPDQRRQPRRPHRGHRRRPVARSIRPSRSTVRVSPGGDRQRLRDGRAHRRWLVDLASDTALIAPWATSRSRRSAGLMLPRDVRPIPMQPTRSWCRGDARRGPHRRQPPRHVLRRLRRRARLRTGRARGHGDARSSSAPSSTTSARCAASRSSGVTAPGPDEVVLRETERDRRLFPIASPALRRRCRVAEPVQLRGRRPGGERRPRGLRRRRARPTPPEAGVARRPPRTAPHWSSTRSNRTCARWRCSQPLAAVAAAAVLGPAMVRWAGSPAADLPTLRALGIRPSQLRGRRGGAGRRARHLAPALLWRSRSAVVLSDRFPIGVGAATRAVPRPPGRLARPGGRVSRSSWRSAPCSARWLPRAIAPRVRRPSRVAEAMQSLGLGPASRRRRAGRRRAGTAAAHRARPHHRRGRRGGRRGHHGDHVPGQPRSPARHARAVRVDVGRDARRRRRGHHPGADRRAGRRPRRRGSQRRSTG